jgi:sterol desaturase/sphingolipid hydroxylase (fatty acid hydroxylase superfamily)
VGPLNRGGKVVARPYGIDWSGDVVLAIISLAFGSPIIAGMGMAHAKWCTMGTYINPLAHPWFPANPLASAAMLALSIPAYMLLWDFHFYWLHLCLHMEPIYSLSHANHHAFKPPLAWSGIAIDPLEEMFSGIGPYLLPMLLPFPFLGYIPFNLPVVYTVNIALVAWATLLHSSSTNAGTWLFMGPIYHNRHHATGRLRNGNYGAIFKVYDRLFGTLLEDAAGVPDYADWTKEEARRDGRVLPGLEGQGEEEAANPLAAAAEQPEAAAAPAAAKKAPSAKKRRAASSGKGGK